MFASKLSTPQALHTVLTKPAQIVSAMRIVEREETIDKEVSKGLWKRDNSHRPKQYRKKVYCAESAKTSLNTLPA